MSFRRALPIVALASVAIAAPASAAPFVLTQQTGIARDVVRGGQWAAWVRCPAPGAAAELWARQIGGAKRLVQIPTTAPLSDCANQQLFGISGSTVFAKIQTGSDPARAVGLVIPTGAETVLDRDTTDAATTRIVWGDAYGPLVAWARDTTQGSERVSEVWTWDARTPATAPVLVRRQTHTGGGRITGVWRGGSGEVMWRQSIPGGQYAAYATGEESLVRRTSTGSLQRISRVTGPVKIAQADLERGYAVYSLIRDDSNAAYIYSRDLASNQKRLLRVAPTAVRPKLRLGPDSPAPKVYGSRVAWRERERLANRSFRDLMRAGSLVGSIRIVASLPDRGDQRIFQSAPDFYGRFATWAIVRFSAPTGWAGGYSGLAPQSGVYASSAGATARTQIVVSAVR